MDSIATKFSKQVLELLKDAGWHEGRKVSDNELKLPYKDYPKKAIDFLKELGNLDINTVVTTATKVTHEVSTYPYTTADTLTEEYKYYGELIGKKLYPIGFYDPEGYYISCDEDCRVYLIGEYCFFAGNSLHEAFDQLLRLDKTPIMRLDEYDVKWFKDGEYLELPPLEE